MKNLCNLTDFLSLIKNTHGLEDAYLFSLLSYSYRKTNIIKRRKKWLVRSYNQLRKWIPLKSDYWLRHHLNGLEEKGFIEKHRGLFYRKHSYFYHIRDDHLCVPIHFNRFQILAKKMGTDIETTLLFCILYEMYKKNSLQWVCLTRKQLATMLCQSENKAAFLFQKLQKKGYILSKKHSCDCISNEHIHIAIPDDIFNSIQNLEASKPSPPLKNKETVPIRIIFSINNNTTLKKSQKKLNQYKQQLHQQWMKYYQMSINEQNKQKKYDLMKKCHNLDSQIIHCKEKIKKINKKLNNKTSSKKQTKKFPIRLNSKGKLVVWQKKYILGALKNSINQNKIKISAPIEFFEQVIYTIENHKHLLKTVKSLNHAINIIIKLCKKNQWRKPYAFI